MHLVNTEMNPNWHDQKQLHDQRRRFQLARLITLSEDMLEGARNGDWNKLEELELLRRVELEECFALQNENPSLLISQALAALIHINDQIVYLVREARDQVSSAFQRNQAGHRAARAYQVLPD
jgi:Flagellar protein FliT